MLEVVQLMAGDTVALLDIPALQGHLEPLAKLMHDPNVLKLLHAGGQDVEILAMVLGAPPAPLYDTQIAAAFAGFAVQAGYGALVQSVLGVTLSKEEGFADWSRRPLTPSMREYAANDVRYLHALHDKLGERLRRRGRDGWAAEQTARVLGSAAAVTPREELWRRVGSRSGLGGRELAVLRELAIWRDDEAQRRDKPRRTVMKDEPLVEIARRKAKTGAEILALRGMPPGLGEKAAASLAVSVAKGLAVPEAERPRLDGAPPLDESGAELLELLSAIVRRRAIEEELPPSLLASSDDLRGLAIARRSPPPDHALFTGWRGGLLGEPLRAALAGKLGVAWDPKADRLVLVPHVSQGGD